MRGTTWAVAIGLVLATSVSAADEQPSEWEFDVVPYAWIAGEFRTVDVKGHAFKVYRVVGFRRNFGTNGSADIQERGPLTALGITF